jgi:hypothetical protein
MSVFLDSDKFMDWIIDLLSEDEKVDESDSSEMINKEESSKDNSQVG